jgi:hypothetical protein
MPNPYYFGQSPDESLGDSPRYFYALRRNEDGELYLLRSDQLKDKDSIDINLPGPPEETFEDLEPGVDFFDGINVNHIKDKQNMYWTQYKWDQRSILYYVDGEGMLVQRINQNYAYPNGTSS